MIHYSSFVNMQYGMRIAHLIWQLGVGIMLNHSINVRGSHFTWMHALMDHGWVKFFLHMHPLYIGFW